MDEHPEVTFLSSNLNHTDIGVKAQACLAFIKEIVHGNHSEMYLEAFERATVEIDDSNMLIASLVIPIDPQLLIDAAQVILHLKRRGKVSFTVEAQKELSGLFWSQSSAEIFGSELLSPLQQEFPRLT